jgi:hypothetical protein
MEWIAAGRARRVELIFADVTAPDWPTLAPALGRVELPAPQRSRKRPRHIPARLRHLFWNADPSLLDAREHGAYIAERLLSTQDLDGLAWGLAALSPDDWERAAQNRGLSSAERAMARDFARYHAGDE